MAAFRKNIAADNFLGLDPEFPDPGPWPVDNNQEFQVALFIKTASQFAGDYHKSHQKFDTIRKLRTLFLNSHESPRGATEQRIPLRDLKGKC